jgi:hypothetical protein
MSKSLIINTLNVLDVKIKKEKGPLSIKPFFKENYVKEKKTLCPL